MEGQERLDLIRKTIKRHVNEGHNFTIVRSGDNVLLRLHTPDSTR